MIDVVSHVDGRCLGSLEINDRLPLCARSLSFALSFSGREISIFFSFFLQPPYGIFFFFYFYSLGFHIFWKSAPIEDDEVGGALGEK